VIGRDRPGTRTIPAPAKTVRRCACHRRSGSTRMDHDAFVETVEGEAAQLPADYAALLARP
jgi:hypothetical protein